MHYGHFVSFSRLKINWEKSQILPLDSFPTSEIQACLPLKRVSLIKYLGVHVSKIPAHYISLNVEPLFTLIKSKIQTWACLPLGVWGRINLMKMILLPKIMCILWHTLAYLPLKYFKTLEALLKLFVWGTNPHKLVWRILKNPTDLGGTALPYFNFYYIASQLSQLYQLDKTDRERFGTFLCPHWAKRTSGPLCAIAVGSGGARPEGDSKTLLYHYRRIWDIATNKMGIPPCNDFTPIWHNGLLPEFLRIPDPGIWGSRGIYYLHHLLSDGELNHAVPFTVNSCSQTLCFSDSYRYAMPCHTIPVPSVPPTAFLQFSHGSG